MNLYNEEDKDNKMYFVIHVYHGFHEQEVFYYWSKTSSLCLLGICHFFINIYNLESYI